MMHCNSPWEHPSQGMQLYAHASALGAYNYGGYLANAFGGSQNIINTISTGTVVVASATKSTLKPTLRCIERLREEITNWHGSILK